MVLVRFFTGQLATAHVLLFLEYESELESLATSLRLKWSERKLKKSEIMFVNFVTYTLLASSSTSLDRFFNILSTSMLCDFKTTPFIERFTISLHSFITLL